MRQFDKFKISTGEITCPACGSRAYKIVIHEVTDCYFKQLVCVNCRVIIKEERWLKDVF